MTSNITMRDMDRLVFYFRVEPDKTCYVNSVEFSNGATQCRLNFHHDNSIFDVFVDGVRPAFQRLIEIAQDSSGLTALPDFAVRFSQVVMSKCRIIVRAVEDGAELVMVRFRNFSGNILALFKNALFRETCTPEPISESVTDAWLRAVQQILNFGTYAGEHVRANAGVLSHGELRAIEAMAERIENLRAAIDIANLHLTRDRHPEQMPAAFRATEMNRISLD